MTYDVRNPGTGTKMWLD